MRVLVGTDFHGNKSKFEFFAQKAEEKQAEIIIISGDITHFGTLNQAKYLLSTLTSLGIPVLFVPGNCDPLSLASVDIEGTKCIHGQNVTYGDVVFIGIGGSPPTPFSTPFEMTENQITEALNHAMENLSINRWLVLVSHAPPYNTRLDKAFLGVHAGSLSVRKFIDDKKPSIVFCGHIHEAKGKDRINNTILVNPGPARHGDYVEAHFNDEISIRFCSL